MEKGLWVEAGKRTVGRSRLEIMRFEREGTKEILSNCIREVCRQRSERREIVEGMITQEGLKEDQVNLNEVIPGITENMIDC